MRLVTRLVGFREAGQEGMSILQMETEPGPLARHRQDELHCTLLDISMPASLSTPPNTEETRRSSGIRSSAIGCSPGPAAAAGARH